MTDIIVHKKVHGQTDEWSMMTFRDQYDYSFFDFTEITHSATAVVVENGMNMYTMFFMHSQDGSSLLEIGLCSEQTSKIDPKFVRKVCTRNPGMRVKLWTGFLHKLDNISPDTVELVSEVSLTVSSSKPLFAWISKCYPQLRGKRILFCGPTTPPPCVSLQFPDIQMYSYESERELGRHTCIAGDSDVTRCICAM